MNTLYICISQRYISRIFFTLQFRYILCHNHKYTEACRWTHLTKYRRPAQAEWLGRSFFVTNIDLKVKLWNLSQTELGDNKNLYLTWNNFYGSDLQMIHILRTCVIRNFTLTENNFFPLYLPDIQSSFCIASEIVREFCNIRNIYRYLLSSSPHPSIFWCVGTIPSATVTGHPSHRSISVSCSVSVHLL